MPRNASFAPSAKMTRSGLSASAQSSRARPPGRSIPGNTGIDDAGGYSALVKPRLQLPERLGRPAAPVQR